VGVNCQQNRGREDSGVGYAPPYAHVFKAVTFVL
jgi:hypothetical protein